MAETLETIAKEWAAELITLDEAVERAKVLDFPKKIREPDGEIWYDGDEANTSLAVYGLVDENILTPDEGHELLTKIAQAL